ncbi:MAG: phytoene/squalene synthase family protein [Bacteroidota bacterium]
MKALFDDVAVKCSKLTTKAYSTSFSLGIYFLNKRLHNPVYSIYGLVRFADEIVDSFHGYERDYLLRKFKADTYEAIEKGISLNPILNSFQHVVNQYVIGHELIETFFNSMEMDLHDTHHSKTSYEKYILGSAEVVGLMCLHVFTEGDKQLYELLKPSAMKLGAAFQKVNFLRDLKADYETLGRTYFPSVNMNQFNTHTKQQIEAEIEADFKEALAGIKKLPVAAKGGVYLAYVYYRALFNKIKRLPAQHILSQRVRISNAEKFTLMLNSMVQYKFNLL